MRDDEATRSPTSRQGVSRLARPLRTPSPGDSARGGSGLAGLPDTPRQRPRLPASPSRPDEEVEVHRHDHAQTQHRHHQPPWVRHLNPLNRSEEVTTETLESAMASEASIGCRVPCQPNSGPTGPPSRNSR
jgi:hypothetical protein